ncbi:MAG: SxtJ family membrane protein [Pyrinomonadaceae bacterium]
MTDKTVVTDSQARKTSLIVAGVLLLIAAWNYHRGRMTIVYVLGGIGCALLIIGLLLPPVARAFHTLWMRLAAILGYVNSRVLLTLLYYLFMTPYGLISRLIGRDPLDRRGPQRETYWIEREQTRQTREKFERIF